MPHVVDGTPNGFGGNVSTEFLSPPHTRPKRRWSPRQSGKAIKICDSLRC